MSEDLLIRRIERLEKLVFALTTRVGHNFNNITNMMPELDEIARKFNIHLPSYPSIISLYTFEEMQTPCHYDPAINMAVELEEGDDSIG